MLTNGAIGRLTSNNFSHFPCQMPPEHLRTWQRNKFITLPTLAPMPGIPTQVPMTLLRIILIYVEPVLQRPVCSGQLG